MKKIFLALFAALFCEYISAEDVLHISPIHGTAGYGIENGGLTGDGCTTLNLYNSPENEFHGLSFQLYVPEKMEVLLYEGEAEDMRRLPYTSKKVGLKTVKTVNHTLVFEQKATCDMVGYKRYQIILTDNSQNTAFIGESGEALLYFYYGFAQDMQEGVYPIYIKDLELDFRDATYIKYDWTTSYAVVGYPTNQSLTMEGVIPSFVNKALKDETAITNLDLSAVTKVNGTFTYVDGRAVTAPTDQNVKADKAVYSRTVGADNYASLKAPFAATDCTNFYKFNTLEGGYANFTEATTIAAGDDLLVKGDIALSAENVVLGHVDAAQVKDDVYYVKDGRFYRGDRITINPLRTCWKLNSVNSNLMIAIDGEPTGIELNTIDGLNTPTYDLQGRRSENAQHGIFVTNGKKQIIK